MPSRDRRRSRERSRAERRASSARAGITDARDAASSADGSIVAGRSPRATTAPATGERDTERQLDRWFVPLAVMIVLVVAGLRLPELALNPFHHDEGVNGFFTTNLVRNGTYTYDPANYHGPSLYYFALVSSWLFGLTTEAMRLVPVVFGLISSNPH